MPLCRRCPAPIVFAKQNATARNPYPANNPLNALPDERGNLRLNRETMTYDVLTGDELRAARSSGEKLYLSHFATCAHAREFVRG
jgi:hypothetical protein